MSIKQKQYATGIWQVSILETVICLPAFVASLLLWWRLPGNATFYLAVIQAFAFWLCWKLLCQNIPPKLLDASERNSFRGNGQRSSRRLTLERKAQAKLRRDFLAVLMTAFLIANFGTLTLYLVWKLPWPQIDAGERLLLAATAIGLLGLSIWQAARFTVGMALADFAKGIRRRSQEFARRDIGNVQAEYFRDQSTDT